MKPLAILLAVTACGVNQTPQPEPGVELPSCVPDRDGVITADELPIAYGATVTYWVSPPGVTRPVTLGATNRVWNLDKEEPDDLEIALGPTPIKDQWYASSFLAGELVVDGGSGLDGIYHQDDQALWLDGTASRDPAPTTRTLIRYTQPIAVLRFPITDGDEFTTLAQIPDGLVSGLPFIGTDEVTVTVIGDGRVDVPYVKFSPAMQVRTLVTRKPSTGTPVVTKRNAIFLFECFGEVARAESRQDEPSAEFTTAAFLRRFKLGVTP